MCVCLSVCVSAFLHGAFRLVGNRPIGTRSSSEPSKGTFRLVGLRNGAFELVGNRPIGTRSSSKPSKGTFRLIGLRNGAFGLVGNLLTFRWVRLTKRSDWSGTDQSGRGVLRS